MSDPGTHRRVSAVIRVFALLSIAALLVAQDPGTAAGHHGGRPIGSFLNCDRPGIDPPRCTSVGDNTRHYVYFDGSLTEGLASSLRDTMAEDYDPTDLTLIEQSELTPLTDVIAFSEDYGDNGAAGWVYCPTDAPQGLNSSRHRRCRQQELHFNLNPRYAVFFADDASRDHVACHELGHTLGLRHWGNPPQSVGPEAYTCMSANTPDGPVTLHQIDIDHINAYRYDTRLPHWMRSVARAPDGGTSQAVAGWLGSVEAMELEHYDSLRAITRSADAVILAKVSALVAGRVFGDSSGSGLQYAAVTLAISEVAAGELPAEHARSLTLELPLFDGPRSLATLRSRLLGDEGIFFLRSKGASARAAGLPRDVQLGDADFYRLVVFDALLVKHAGRAVVSSDAPGFLSALNGLPFDELTRLIHDHSR